MEIGTLIRTKHNIHNYPERDGYRWKYIYFKLCDGKFEINHQYDGLLGKFEGKHFVCQGSDYWVKMFGGIFGLELLEEQFEIVNELPDNLIV